MNHLADANLLIMFSAGLMLAGILSSLVASRFGAPLLLVFLALGMLVGEDGPGGIHFSDYRATYLIGSIALAIILFDGGLRTKVSRFRGALAPAGALATFGVMVSVALTALFARAVLGSPWTEALLLGAMVSSTDAAAVFFLLRTGGLQLKPRVGAILEIESSTNDPVAVLFTIALTEIILAQSGATAPDASLGSLGWMLTELFREATIGTLTGLGSGLLLVKFMNSVQLPGGLHPLLIVAGAVFCYSATMVVGGSGFLAVYLAGLLVGNRPLRAYPSILAFHDAATWFSQLLMFLVLGLLVTPSRLLSYAVPGMAIALFVMLVARPIAVWLCLWPYRVPRDEKLFISWVGLRGAVSIFLAAIPTLAGVPHAEAFFNIAFFVVLISLLLQGWTITSAARWLGIARSQNAHPVNRVELDIPGQFDQEIVGYPIQERSFALSRQALPPWAKLVLVVRGHAILNPAEAGKLAAGDYAYFLTPPARVPRLDGLFAERDESEDPARGPLFGELPVNGETRLSSLAALYGFDLEEEQDDITVNAAFAQEFDNAPESGDQLMLGGRAILIARKIEGTTVRRAGLQLDELMDTLVASAQLRNSRVFKILAALRRRIIVEVKRLFHHP